MSLPGDPTVPKMSHVFLNRFNLSTPSLVILVHEQDGLSPARWDLSTRFTVPSVFAQTKRKFEWIVVDDAAAREVARQTETELTGLVAAQYRRNLGKTRTQHRLQEGVLS